MSNRTVTWMLLDFFQIRFLNHEQFRKKMFILRLITF